MKFSTAWHLRGGAVRKEQAGMLNTLPFMLTVHLLPIQTEVLWSGSHTPVFQVERKGEISVIIFCCYEYVISFNISRFFDLSVNSKCRMCLYRMSVNSSNYLF